MFGIESIGNNFSSCIAYFFTKFRIEQQLINQKSEVIDIVDFDKESISAAFNEPWYSADGCGYGGYTVRHCLENAHGHTFILRGKAVHRGPLEQGFTFATGDPAAKLAAVSNA